MNVKELAKHLDSQSMAPAQTKLKALEARLKQADWDTKKIKA